MKLNVTKIEIVFSKGSFAEWVNIVEEQDEKDIARWEAAYNKQIEQKIKERYPHAEIEVGEGHQQLAHTKCYVDTQECVDSEDCDHEFYDEYIAHYLAQEEAKFLIDEIITQVANAGAFWD